jgi:preprotein translocase subunit YajC
MQNMSGLLDQVPLLFAQDAGGSSIWTLIFMAPIPILFYLMIIQPQQQERKRQRSMIESLKKNDKVVTSAGIYGTVTSVDGNSDRIVLRVDDERQVKMAFTKSSVVRVLESSDKPAESA